MARTSVTMDDQTARRVGAATIKVEGMPSGLTAPTEQQSDPDPIPFHIGEVSESGGIAPGGSGTVTPWTINPSSFFAATSQPDVTCYDWFLTGADLDDRVMYFRHRMSGKLIFLLTTYAYGQIST